MDAGELLQRLAGTLRTEVAPAVGDEYTRTQTHMAGVILGKLGRQLALAPVHAEAEREDLSTLYRDLADLLGPSVDPNLSAVVDEAREVGTVAALGPVIQALYRTGVDTDPAVASALDRIRLVLRADIDRKMEIAR